MIKTGVLRHSERRELLNVLNEGTEHESSERALKFMEVSSDFDSTIRGFEPPRPSQAVQRLETLPPDLREMPANCGVLRFNGWSPGTDLGHFRLGLAASLRRILEIFPFLGDRHRRPGSIRTAWPSLQCNSPSF